MDLSYSVLGSGSSGNAAVAPAAARRGGFGGAASRRRGHLPHPRRSRTGSVAWLDGPRPRSAVLPRAASRALGPEAGVSEALGSPAGADVSGSAVSRGAGDLGRTVRTQPRRRDLRLPPSRARSAAGPGGVDRPPDRHRRLVRNRRRRIDRCGSFGNRIQSRRGAATDVEPVAGADFKKPRGVRSLVERAGGGLAAGDPAALQAGDAPAVGAPALERRMQSAGPGAGRGAAGLARGRSQGDGDRRPSGRAAGRFERETRASAKGRRLGQSPIPNDSSSRIEGDDHLWRIIF